MTKILIADDHGIVRKGLKQILLEQYPTAIIGEAETADLLIASTLKEKWDLVICDMSMPGRSGLDALNQIKQSTPQLPVLIMSMHPEDQYAVRVLKAGAAGFLGKETIHEDIIKAIETVRLGKKYITPEIAEKLAEALDTGIYQPLHQTLSDREFDVFKLLASGKSVTEIGEQLLLSATTISTYRSRIMEKMGMRSNSDLTRYALENGII